MADRLQCEFSLIRYVPDVVKGEFANIGVVLRAPDGAAQVKFTRDWSRVRCMDPDADTELLEALEAEIAARLEAGVVETVNAKPIVQTLEDSLSNSVQLTEMRATLAESVVAEMEQLMRMYVEPLKVARVRQKQSGRALIAGEMRDAFERAGVWKLMRKKIAASQYTQAGDPLKLDCGYRNGKVRMFQAVSLESDVEGAKGLAYSASRLRGGVARVEGVELELTAVVERRATVGDEEQYAFGLSVMEREAIRVLTVADLARAAETARYELKV
ncbi:DUF3037 domain-containing protein [Granulicella cerasi]|uniref:DUF3037 domain-containing protein n=1 Tax=Granulicella cerasi TaxID=741063 RepID=A0ABW1Z9R1_9BACT|nr:DUF3037 domain-containing protein [Granulicella cerasi]